MKKFILLFILLHKCGFLFCQRSFGLDVGYNIPIAPQDITDGGILFMDNGSIRREVLRFSYGAGLNYALFFNQVINRHISANIRLAYSKGKTYVRKIEYDNSFPESTDKLSGNMLWIMPNLRLNNFNFKNKIVYFEIGPSFGVLGKIIDEKTYYDSFGMYNTKSLRSKGVSFGVSAATGINFQPFRNNKWNISAAIRIISASYAPKQRNMIYANLNGVDILSTIPLSDRKSIYKKNYISNSNIPIDPNTPRIQSKQYYPFSSMSLNIGIEYLIK